MKILVLWLGLLLSANVCVADPHGEVGQDAPKKEGAIGTGIPANPEEKQPPEAKRNDDDEAAFLREVFPHGEASEVQTAARKIRDLKENDPKPDFKSIYFLIDVSDPKKLEQALKTPEKLGLKPESEAVKWLLAALEARGTKKSEDLDALRKSNDADAKRKLAALIELNRRSQAAEALHLQSRLGLDPIEAVKFAEQVQESPEKAFEILAKHLDPKDVKKFKTDVVESHLRLAKTANALNLTINPALQAYFTNLEKAADRLEKADLIRLAQNDVRKTIDRPRHNGIRFPPQQGNGGGHAQNGSHSNHGWVSSPPNRQYVGNQGQKIKYPEAAAEEKPSRDLENLTSHSNVKMKQETVENGELLPVSQGPLKNTCFISDSGFDPNGAISNYAFIFDGIVNETKVGDKPGAMHIRVNPAEGGAGIARAVRECYEAHKKKHPGEAFHLTLASHGSDGQNQLLHPGTINDFLEGVDGVDFASVTLLSCNTGKAIQTKEDHVVTLLAENLKGKPTVAGYDDLVRVGIDRVTVDGCMGADANLQNVMRDRCVQVHKVMATRGTFIDEKPENKLALQD